MAHGYIVLACVCLLGLNLRLWPKFLEENLRLSLTPSCRRFWSFSDKIGGRQLQFSTGGSKQPKKTPRARKPISILVVVAGPKPVLGNHRTRPVRRRHLRVPAPPPTWSIVTMTSWFQEEEAGERFPTRVLKLDFPAFDGSAVAERLRDLFPRSEHAFAPPRVVGFCSHDRCSRVMVVLQVGDEQRRAVLASLRSACAAPAVLDLQ